MSAPDPPTFDPPIQFFLPELDRIREALHSASPKYGIKMLDNLVTTIHEMQNCPECVLYKTYRTHAENHTNDVRCVECAELAEYCATKDAQIGQAFCRRHWTTIHMYSFHFVLRRKPTTSEWLIIKNRHGLTDLPDGLWGWP